MIGILARKAQHDSGVCPMSNVLGSRVKTLDRAGMQGTHKPLKPCRNLAEFGSRVKTSLIRTVA
jgi:hypothetical protein